MGAAVNEIDRVVALERIKDPGVAVDADVAATRRLALDDRAAAQVRLDVHAVRRHHCDQGLTQPRGRLRPEVAHLLNSHRVYGSRTIAPRRYDVNGAAITPLVLFLAEQISSSSTNSLCDYQDRVSSYPRSPPSITL